MSRFLPPGHAVVTATEEIDALFGESGEVSIVTLIFRGDALTPGGISQMSALVGAIAADPGVGGLLVPSDPIISPSFLLQAALQRQSLEGITQAEIDAVRNIPQIQGAIDAMTGTDADGTQVAIANIRLTDTGDDRVKDAERRINELAANSQGALSVSSLSPTIVEDEYREATETGMAPLIGLALLLIAVLLLVFMRTLSDMLLTLAGLIISLTWIVGAEGWLGPNGIGIIGPP